jgi:hypothetical protein
MAGDKHALTSLGIAGRSTMAKVLLAAISLGLALLVAFFVYAAFTL